MFLFFHVSIPINVRKITYITIPKSIISVWETDNIFLPTDKTRFILIIPQEICCGYALESSHWDDSNEHPQHMFKESEDNEKRIKIFVENGHLSIWTCFEGGML